ncbi:TetR/AcrR family transcriptional regulator [Gordoniibacillus kamchatkensis]|uniref:TetR/AcrR family transcriptional regulator n=1 Tax=Gordoniibacillus kamchatkensis TaxID=1590651 RepID=UPI000696C435|nr:helix-turn-helix domain-containing protein [Paenibacillus sp. VKM B-2647]
MQDKREAWVEELLELFDGEDKVTEKQIRILQAAVETFSEKGYASASTSEIAKKAGVAEGTIFRHFKTKNDLLLSIVTPMISKIIAPLMMKDFLKVLHTEHVQWTISYGRLCATAWSLPAKICRY